MFDAVALGELLVDFVLKDKGESFPLNFSANPGGAPCNVLCQLAKLGKSTAFVGKVGNDVFGKELKKTLEGYSICTDYLFMSETEFTTLAFVTLDSQGDRSFSFSRKNSADVMLNADEIDERLFENTRLFHCGTLSFTDESSRLASIKALELAKSRGKLISFDPNLRPMLWKNEMQAKNAMDTVLLYADIVKMSDSELEFFTSCKDIKTGAKEIFQKYKTRLLFVTCGKDGAFAFSENAQLYDSGISIKAVDTTGAGDSFFGAVISEILDLDKALEEITKAELEKILRFANLTAALSTTGYGAMPSMKTREEIGGYINGKKH